MHRCIILLIISSSNHIATTSSNQFLYIVNFNLGITDFLPRNDNLEEGKVFIILVGHDVAIDNKAVYCTGNNSTECTCKRVLNCSLDSSTNASFVCGTDGNTYKSSCHLSFNSCMSQNSVGFLYNGPCQIDSK